MMIGVLIVVWCLIVAPAMALLWGRFIHVGKGDRGHIAVTRTCCDCGRTWGPVEGDLRCHCPRCD